MKKTQFFSVEMATKYGVIPAILIENFIGWKKNNKTDGEHFYDGRTWTCNSKKELSKLFPYLSEKQIRYAIDKLLEQGVLITGNYNKTPYDRTLWYAFKDEKTFLNALDTEKNDKVSANFNGKPKNLKKTIK